MHGAAAAEGLAGACASSQAWPRARHILPPCLSNVLLIYTCWARGCIGMGRTLMASITQQASLLPFKIHFKRLCGTEVRPCIVAVLMSGCEQHQVAFILFLFFLFF